jgi:AcrR family transcriptional regulator
MAATAGVKDAVRTAAVDLFAKNGFANTSVQQIVDAAGVTKGAMYHYFCSKDELLFGIYEHLLTLQGEHLAAIVATGDTTEQKLRAACIDVIETSIEFLDEGTVFFRSAHMLPAEKQLEVKHRRREYNDQFVSLVEAGQREGVYRTRGPCWWPISSATCTTCRSGTPRMARRMAVSSRHSSPTCSSPGSASGTTALSTP